MKREIRYTDYCPMLDEDYSISVKYQKVSTFSSQAFIKDSFRCEHNICGDFCKISDCPVYLSAPETLQ